MNLVRNHSHWGAFLAEVEGGRVVGVQPFEKDPDPSHLINAIPECGAFEIAHRTADGARGLAQTWPRSQRRPRPRAVRAGVVGQGARSGCRRDRAGPPRTWQCRDHGRLAGLVVGRAVPRGAGAASSLSRGLGRLRRSGDELQLRRGAGVPAAYRRQPAVGGRAADLVVIDRAALQADGAVRRRQPEEHTGEQGRLCVALHPRLDRGIGARRRRGGEHQSDPRRRPGRGSSGMDSDPAEHRYRDAARHDAHLGERRPARPAIPRQVLRRLRSRAALSDGRDRRPAEGRRLGRAHHWRSRRHHPRAGAAHGRRRGRW